MTVGVQIQDTEDWFPVAFVKAKDVAAFETAVIRQRALIAEVSAISFSFENAFSFIFFQT